ncbi:MAG: GldL-related protein, partial [Bacteroidota bacterium]
MAKTKKLDVFNLFYSGAAVIILLGVIAKLLEWPMQDFLITFGLAIEAVVFGVTAIKFVEVKKDTEVATEATLAKVADGLGAIKSTANSFAGNLSTDTNISISGVD